MVKRLCTIVLVLVLGASLAPAGAQRAPNGAAPGAASDSQRSDVTAILVDVVVRNRAGQAVENLRPEEFEIFEDGVKQEIGSVTPIFKRVDAGGLTAAPLPSTSGAAAGAAAGAPSAQSRPAAVDEAVAAPTEVLALVFDRLSPDARALSYDAAVRYLESEQPDRLVGVYGLDLSLIAYQPFTRDTARVRQALDRFAHRATSTFGAGGTETQDTTERSLRAGDQLSAVTAGGGGDSTAIGAAAAEAEIAAMQDRTLQTFETLERDQRGYSTANGLLAVMTGMRSMPGRKAIVFFSEGLSIPPNAQDRFTSVIAEANRSNVSIYSIDAGGLRTESTLNETRDDLTTATRRRMERNASRDVMGEPMMAALERNEDRLRFDPHSGLGQLSDNTGGLLISNTNDFRHGLSRVDSDLRNYYMLSYVPGNEKFDGRYRTISVRVNRPGLTVQHRKGYLAVRAPSSEPVLTHEAPALATLEQRPVPNAFPMRAGALRFPEPSRPGLTPVVVELPMSGVTFRPSADGTQYTSDLTILVQLQDADGKPLTKFSQRYEVQGPIDQIERAKVGEIIFYRELELPPGLYRMDTVAYDALSGEASVRFTTIEKPQIPGDRLRMSSLVLVKRGEKVPESERIPGSPLHVGDTLIYPRLGIPLKQGVDTELPFYFTVYLPKSGGDPRAVLELLQNAKPLATVPLQLASPDAERRIQQLSRIPIQELAPGTYELRVTVRQGSTAISHTADFRVVG